MALDELHPDARGIVVFVRAVHRDDVRVANTGQKARLIEGRPRRGRAPGQELQRDLAIETRVPCAVDRPEGARADRFENNEVPPRGGSARRGGIVGEGMVR